MEGFDGLTSAFNIKPDDKLEEVKEDLAVIESKKTALVSKIGTNGVMFDDQVFLQAELKSLIMSINTVRSKVEQDIKIGVPPRVVEVYAKLIESIGKQYATLIELNKAIFQAKVETNQVDIEKLGGNKISLTSDQLLDMVLGARKSSQMKEIDAVFVTDDEIIPTIKGGR